MYSLLSECGFMYTDLEIPVPIHFNKEEPRLLLRDVVEKILTLYILTHTPYILTSLSIFLLSYKWLLFTSYYISLVNLYTSSFDFHCSYVIHSFFEPSVGHLENQYIYYQFTSYRLCSISLKFIWKLFLKWKFHSVFSFFDSITFNSSSRDSQIPHCLHDYIDLENGLPVLVFCLSAFLSGLYLLADTFFNFVVLKGFLYHLLLKVILFILKKQLLLVDI